MELATIITGQKLIEIQKGVNLIKIVFENNLDQSNTILSFQGYLFETNISVLNRKVEYANLRNTLGFKAVAQLRYDKQDFTAFKQLLIQMEGTDDENKIELIAVFKSYTINENICIPVAIY